MKFINIMIMKAIDLTKKEIEKITENKIYKNLRTSYLLSTAVGGSFSSPMVPLAMNRTENGIEINDVDTEKTLVLSPKGSTEQEIKCHIIDAMFLKGILKCEEE